MKRTVEPSRLESDTVETRINRRNRILVLSMKHGSLESVAYNARSLASLACDVLDSHYHAVNYVRTFELMHSGRED